MKSAVVDNIKSSGCSFVGSVIGGAIGSVIPVVGTAVGSFVGGLIGGLFSSWFWFIYSSLSYFTAVLIFF